MLPQASSWCPPQARPAFCADLIERTEEPCRQALADAGFSAGEINEVILVGGMIRMPAVQESVKRIFGKEPHKGVNPDEVVAVGLEHVEVVVVVEVGHRATPILAIVPGVGPGEPDGLARGVHEVT